MSEFTDKTTIRYDRRV